MTGSAADTTLAKVATLKNDESSLNDGDEEEEAISDESSGEVKDEADADTTVIKDAARKNDESSEDDSDEAPLEIEKGIKIAPGEEKKQVRKGSRPDRKSSRPNRDNSSSDSQVATSLKDKFQMAVQGRQKVSSTVVGAKLMLLQVH